MGIHLQYHFRAPKRVCLLHPPRPPPSLVHCHLGPTLVGGKMHTQHRQTTDVTIRQPAKLREGQGEGSSHDSLVTTSLSAQAPPTLLLSRSQSLTTSGAMRCDTPTNTLTTCPTPQNMPSPAAVSSLFTAHTASHTEERNMSTT